MSTNCSASGMETIPWRGSVLEWGVAKGGRMANSMHKPPADLVKKAAVALDHPEKASMLTIKRMAAEVLDNQQYDRKPPLKKPVSKKK